MACIVKHPSEEGVIRSAPPAAAACGAIGTWVLAATILGSSMVFIDGTVVTVALPVMQSALHATTGDVQWIVEAYNLFLAALLLVGGALGDRFGRRLVFGIGVALFALASIWCGLAPDVRQLIWARAVQGVGGALLTPGSLAIISATFSAEERGRAIGTWSGFTAITAAVGPLLGGWLIQHASWHWIFFVNVPLALIVLGLVFWKVPESRDEAAKGLDGWGAVLATLALGGIVYGLIASSALGLKSPVVLGTIAGGLICGGAFLTVEAHSKTPMMPLDLFRSRTFSGTNLLTLLLYAGLAIVLYYVPFNLIQVQHYSPMAAGAALLPFILLMFLFSRWAGGLVHRYGARRPLIIGPLIAAVGFALFAIPGIGGSYWTTFFPAVLVLGIGMAISVAPLTTAVMGAVSTDKAGIASGINNAVSRTAGLLAIACVGIIVFSVFSGQLDRHLQTLKTAPETRQALESQRTKLAEIQVPSTLLPQEQGALKRAIAQAFVDSFRVAALIAAGLAIASALSAALLIASDPQTPDT